MTSRAVGVVVPPERSGESERSGGLSSTVLSRQLAGLVLPWRCGTYGRAKDTRSTFSEARGGRGGSKTLAQQGFPVERVTGIEPAWSAWKASGTRSRLSVKMAVDLHISVFDLDRCSP
jgi:hypothetical protein